MLLIVSKYLIPKGFRGFTVFPFVFLANKEDGEDAVTVNHEKIHLRQQLELLILPFFLWYGMEFLIKWILLKDKNKAYKAISFEKEAYENETKMTYLKVRKTWFFLRYL